jgi:hypothetical protein
VVALALATGRVVFVDPHWYADLTPRLTPADLVHVAVVACLAWGGALARRVRDDQVRILTPDGLRGLLWIAASLLCAALIWRETTGLWPALLLSVEVLALGGLARWLREPRAPTFAVALPLVAAALLLRMFMEDQALARAAASSLVNGVVLTRIGGCIAIGVAGAWLARSDAEDGARTVGHLLSATAAFALLMALSLGWTDHQNGLVHDALGARRRDLVEDIRWRTQVGLSVLWTLYAAGTLAWGFIRRSPAVRYGALGLFGIVIVKVFMADLAAVETVYRIISFLILGLVLLGVSFLYQKARGRVG